MNAIRTPQRIATRRASLILAFIGVIVAAGCAAHPRHRPRRSISRD